MIFTFLSNSLPLEKYERGVCKVDICKVPKLYETLRKFYESDLLFKPVNAVISTGSA